MAGRTPQERERIAGLEDGLLAIFRAAGFAHIAPDIIQPADVFLERSGEDIRQRTFVFTDPDGNELCLRPDLTVPAVRYYLSHAGVIGEEARYCYAGPAFRHQPGPDKALRPREFDQAGVEWFAAGDAASAQAAIIALAGEAVEQAGLSRFTVRLGDLGLFDGLLAAIDMPERWRRRLRRQFWRPRQFRALLASLSGETTRARSSISDLVDRLATADMAAARSLVAGELAARKLELVGGRSIDDMAERLVEKVRDRAARPLGRDQRDLIERYLAIDGPLATVEGRLEAIADDAGGAFTQALQRFRQRNAALAAAGRDPAGFRFSGEFGRNLEYYTGVVFQIEAAGGDGEPLIVAGGGAYDNLIGDISAGPAVDAVGLAIHTERLLAAIGGDGR